MITTMQVKGIEKKRILKPTLYSQEFEKGKNNLVALTRMSL
jgi:hypothetical protein